MNTPHNNSKSNVESVHLSGVPVPAAQRQAQDAPMGAPPSNTAPSNRMEGATDALILHAGVDSLYLSYAGHAYQTVVRIPRNDLGVFKQPLLPLTQHIFSFGGLQPSRTIFKGCKCAGNIKTIAFALDELGGVNNRHGAMQISDIEYSLKIAVSAAGTIMDWAEIEQIPGVWGR